MSAIALASFREASNKKIFHLLAVLTIIYLAVLTTLVSFMASGMSSLNNFAVYMNVSSIISLLGFYFSSMLVALLTVMLSIGLVSSEIENATIYTIVTKPIKRSTYIIGKYLGTAVLVTGYSILLYLAIVLLPLIVNVSFIKSLGILNLVNGLLFFMLEPLVILALCLYGSTKLKTLNNGIFVISIYILGLIGGVMEQVGLMLNSDIMFKIGILTSLISPFDSVYRRMMSSIFSSSGILNYMNGLGIFTGAQTIPSAWMTIYVFIYLAAFVYLAARRFNRRDL